MQWFRRQQTRTKVGLGCGLFLAVLMFFSCVSAAFGSQSLVPATTPTSSQQIAQTQRQVTPLPARQQPMSRPTHAASPAAPPTVRPQATPTVRPTPKPTQPQPTPCSGVNCNPWGYNFTPPGNLIYNPPANFCQYFPCITSFWESDDPGDGYVVQCADGLFSQSGGERGACSRHGGVSRPLYSH